MILLMILKNIYQIKKVDAVLYCAHSSVVERHIDIVKARGSIPRARTK